MVTEHFKAILNNYLDSITIGNFNKNHEMFKLINYTATDAIGQVVSDFGLTARGSSGAGTWTKYPWIAVYNEAITTTIQKGVYIVYLFAQQMDAVYLTLNQGCTVLKNELGTKAAREEMTATGEKIRSIVQNNRFNEDNDLDIGNMDYEIGSVFYKKYSKDNFPNEEEFLDDLSDMIRIYNDYYQQIFLKNQPRVLPTNEIHTGVSVVKSKIMEIEKYIKAKGFIFSYESLSNFYLSLKTKPFVILAGISGTGKSKLVKLFGEAIAATSANGQYTIISVKPDWNDSTELFGYKNINDKFVPGQLVQIIQEASKPENIHKPYLVCLDEMNLARVEYYLSDYLSIIESRYFDHEGCLLTDRIFSLGYFDDDHPYAKLVIPENIYIVGTVNMDDTTFSFSRKVLDRANTIEFSDVRLDILEFEQQEEPKASAITNELFKTRFLSIKDAINFDKEYVNRINNRIIQINNILETGGYHFAYRIRDEIVFYMLENKASGLLDENTAFDYQIMQKILPTIMGSSGIIKDILIDLYNYCNPTGQIVAEMDYIEHGEANLESALYYNSAKKILMMLRGYEDGFVSFW